MMPENEICCPLGNNKECPHPECIAYDYESRIKHLKEYHNWSSKQLRDAHYVRSHQINISNEAYELLHKTSEKLKYTHATQNSNIPMGRVLSEASLANTAITEYYGKSKEDNEETINVNRDELAAWLESEGYEHEEGPEFVSIASFHIIKADAVEKMADAGYKLISIYAVKNHVKADFKIIERK